MTELESLKELRKLANERIQDWERPLFAQDEYKAIREIADAIQAEVEANYMPYLLDADGEPIRIGDSVDACKWHESGTVEGFTVNCRTHDGDLVWYDACDLTHAKPRTVEDVLHDFAIACEEAGFAGHDVWREIAKYAAELQMKGGE